MLPNIEGFCPELNFFFLLLLLKISNDRTELSIRSGSTGPPSDSMWSGSPFRVVAGVMIGNATESAEHNANLNFFFASLKEKNH